jgi:predicted transcriptional regulator
MNLNILSHRMWILIGALIALIGGFVSAYFAYKEGQSSQKQTDRIDSTVQSTDSLVKSLREQVVQQEQKIESLKEDLVIAQKRTIEEMEKASNAQKQVIDYTTGGDSFPYIFITDWVGNLGTVYIVNTNSKNHSKNPLQNLNISIIDARVFVDLLYVQMKSPRDIRYESTVLAISIDWLSPHASNEIGKIDIGEFVGGERKYNAFIEANGKKYSEQIVIRKKLGKFFFGISLRDANNVPIRITYQPGFLDSGEEQYNFPIRTFGKFTHDESGNLVAQ